MSDIESSTIESPQVNVNSFSKSLRPIVGTCLAIASLAALALSNTSGIISSAKTASSMQLEVVKQGKQPIRAGCANIYGSDPDQVFIDPNTGLRVLTAVFTICDDRSLNGVALSALGFDPVKDIDMGVSYVETGKGAWLTLYDGPNFNGKSVVISPLTSMHLKYVGGRNWNDLARSLTTRSTTGDGVALYLSHRIPLGSVNDHCVALYTDHPDTNPKADGLYLCGDKSTARKWTFELFDIIEQGFNIAGEHFGIEYIQTGRRVKLVVYDGPNIKSLNAEPLLLGGHEYLDLSTVKFGTTGEHWDSKPRSFELVEL